MVSLFKTASAAFAVTVGVSLVAEPVANAAVKECKPPIISDLSTGSSDLIAKRRAIESWTLRAKTHGIRFTSWRLASKRILKCVRGKQGETQCIAYGSPCTLQQVPTRPRDKGRPIAT